MTDKRRRMRDIVTVFVIRSSPPLPSVVDPSRATPIAPGGATRCRTGTAGPDGTVGLIDEAKT
jgi:hypothetical protein